MGAGAGRDAVGVGAGSVGGGWRKAGGEIAAGETGATSGPMMGRGGRGGGT